MDEQSNIFGPIVIIIFMLISVFLVKQRRKRKLEIAKNIARRAHKILATTDGQIYMYDMKVQLRHEFPNIDKYWKLTVRFIEGDSHVLVGVTGSRHDVYWKWIHPNSE